MQSFGCELVAVVVGTRERPSPALAYSTASAKGQFPRADRSLAQKTAMGSLGSFAQFRQTSKLTLRRNQPGQGVSTVPVGRCVDEGCVMVAEEVLVRQIDEFASTTTSRAVHARDLRTITESVLFLSPGSSHLRIENEAASIGNWDGRRSAAAGSLHR